MDVWLLFRFLIFFLLLLLSSFFSAAEVALFSLKPVQVEMLRERKGKAGKTVAALLETPHRLLVTIYIGNEIVNVAIAAVSTIIALHYFMDYGIAFSVGFGTFMLLVFGEITPKTFALNHAEAYSLMAARPLMLFSRIIYPLQVSVTWITNALLSLFEKGTEPVDSRRITEDEVKFALLHGEVRGVIGSGEKEMIMNVFELGDTLVTDIMTPRTEIFALEVDEGFAAISRKAILSNYSRIPVYRKDVDHIVGILYTKDLLSKRLDSETLEVEKILHEPYFIPATKKVDELLREFRKNKVHVAIILDEYGGVEGMVTLEDILQDVVGDHDELKTVEQIVKIDDLHYMVPARLSIEDFNEYFRTNLVHEDIDTVGGMVFHLFGRTPKWGESVDADGVTFTVKKLKGPMIWQLSVQLKSGLTEGTDSPEGTV